MMEDPIVLKLFLIGFHHKKGWVEEINIPDGDSSGLDLEHLEHLPTLALPDQSHNFKADSVYFIFPTKHPSDNRKIFGVSCFRQISIEKLKTRSENDEYSRSSVQKAVCCLSRLPLYGYIEIKLNIIVDKIFEEGNFDCHELLKHSFHELNRCLKERIKIDLGHSTFVSLSSDCFNDFYIETCLRELMVLWRHKALVLFKLFLMEKRVLFFGSPVKPVCTTIISIMSLHPHLLSQGLSNDFSEPKSEVKVHVEQPLQLIGKDASSPLAENCENCDCIISNISLPTIPPTEYLAPLQLFKNGYLCLPFISLPYIDVISDKLHNGFIVGASNVLFMQKKNLVDVLIDVPTQSIDFIDPDVKKSLTLTTEDLRFFEHVMRGIDSPRNDGYGTDSWIREQFESYFTSMLRTAYDEDNQRDLECFNETYMNVWKKTNNFQDWLAKKLTRISNDPEMSAFDTFPKGHPFSKQTNVINVSDFRNKIVQSINNTQSARKINQAVNNTIVNAKNTFASWLSNLSQKDDTNKEGDVVDMDDCGKKESVE